LTPGGTSSLIGETPWRYATKYLNIAYRTDPAAVAAYLVLLPENGQMNAYSGEVGSW